MLTAALKQPKCPSANEWITKMWYIHNGLLLSHKKEQNKAVCSNMGGHQMIRLSDVSQSYHDITYMWNLKR